MKASRTADGTPSVQWRVLVRQFILLAVLFAGLVYGLGGYLKGLLYDANLEVARRSSLLTTRAIQAKMLTTGEHEVWTRVLQGIPLQERSHIEVVSPAGKVLFATDPTWVGRTYTLDHASCAVCHAGGSTAATVETARIQADDESAYQVFGSALVNADACRTCHADDASKLGMVIVHQSLDAVDRQVQTVRLALVLTGVAVFLLTMMTTRLLLARYLGRPLRRLLAGAQAIGAGSLDQRIEVPEPSELSVLADVLNDSAAKLSSMIGALSSRRDDLAILYRLTDQLSRAVLPGTRRRRAVGLASRILKRECVLVRLSTSTDAGSPRGTVTYRGPDGLIRDRSREEAEASGELPPFYEPEIAAAWGRGAFAGQAEIHVGSTVAYPLRRRGRDLGLLLTAAGEAVPPPDHVTAEVVEALIRHFGIGLGYSDLQQDLIDKERLAAIGQTVAGLAHCLKNLLNGLRAGVYVTNRGFELQDQEKIETGWRVLKNSIAQVERLTFDMLYYVKERTPMRGPAQPNKILEEVLEFLTEMAAEQGVELTADLDPAVGTITLDRTAIYRAVLNLVSNAIDACAESASGRHVVVSSRVAGDEVLIAVRDDGTGMSEDVQERLFKRLFSTKHSKGTGLGLPVARKIAEEHGGTLDYVSEPDAGSTFTIHLPRTAES